ncbi:hypothetical protein GCM10008015_29990 [Flavobacterium palustre]|uniref:Uncharacterized protein n=1 Tax=Flavobacterium palustre TaxID=1476463 RepID=A0ABQ1HTA0_9FLAO|nr:hypothetical protein [Flavobacterium palustre]GGA87326.1 hypothetical protein GCM10008015_29990 [Flavobacterium palustre]
MKIGKIVSVEYDKFRVKLFHNTKVSTINIDGKVYYFGNIGSFLKVNNSIGDSIICEVVAVLDNSNESKPFSEFNLDSARELIIKPIGTLDKNNKFLMGVGIFPSIYSDTMIVTEENMKGIMLNKNEVSTTNKIHDYIDIGISKNFIHTNQLGYIKYNENENFNNSATFSIE